MGLTAAVVFRNLTNAVDLWADELGGIALKYKIKDCKPIQILLLLVTYILHYVRSKSNPFQTDIDKVFYSLDPPRFPEQHQF